MHDLEPEARKEAVRALAEELLMQRIGRALPATPIAIACTALLQSGGKDVASIQGRIREVTAELRRRGAPTAFGHAFESLRRRRTAEKAALRVREFDIEVLDAEEAELILTLTVAQFSRRRILRRQGGELRIPDVERPVVEYYANSIRHHLA